MFWYLKSRTTPTISMSVLVPGSEPIPTRRPIGSLPGKYSRTKRSLTMQTFVDLLVSFQVKSRPAASAAPIVPK